MDCRLLLFVTLSLIPTVVFVHGATVTVSRNITVKTNPDSPSGPRVDITLECIGSSSDLSYYIKNEVYWDFKGSNGVVHPITRSFYAATGNTAQYADLNFKAGRFEFKYEARKDTGFYQFILLIKGVKYSDDGEYTCTLIAESKTVADKKTVKVTVVHPVDSVMLTLYDSMNHTYKDSNASVTDSIEAVQIKPGSYRVECQAKGSNPAPKVEIRFEGASIAMSDIGEKSVFSGRPSYSKTISVTTDVAAMDMDQLFSCDANIAGNHYISKVASIKVKAIIGPQTKTEACVISCTGGACILKAQLCDGSDDCEDRSDEFNCTDSGNRKDAVPVAAIGGGVAAFVVFALVLWSMILIKRRNRSRLYDNVVRKANADCPEHTYEDIKNKSFRLTESPEQTANDEHTYETSI